MANAIPNRPGQIENAGYDRQLYLDIFSGEVLTAFERATIMRPTVMERQITEGRSTTFPVIGRATQGYHTVGTELTGTSIPTQQVSLGVDDMNVSHVFVAEIDELLVHYDVRGPYAEAMGEALAVNFDQNVTRALTLTARSGPTLSSLPGGGSIIGATFNSDGNALFDGIRAAKRGLHVKNVPVRSGLYGIVPTVQWYLIAGIDRMTNRFYTPSADTSSWTTPDVLNVDGVMVRSSNVLPFGTDESAASSVLTKYQGNWTNTAGLVYHQSAAGTVIRLGPTATVERDGRRLGDLLVAKQLVGHGKLRPESAIELKTA